jgi:hypothetical protein
MTTPIPEDFQYSYSALKDWEACRRRFLLRHLRRMAYPAQITGDALTYETHQARGSAFHHLVYQHHAGIPAETLALGIQDGQLRGWWERYLAFRPNDLPPTSHAETTLTAPLGNFRLVGTFDLLAVQPGGKAVIVDWKTSPHVPTAEQLARNLQTVIYRYLLVTAGSHYNGKQPIDPANVEMIYWYAEAPQSPIRLPYSAAQYAADARHLAELGAQVESEQDFPKVDEAQRERVCSYCNYRALCWGDVRAGLFADSLFDPEDDAPMLEDAELLIDLDDIGEIAF